MSYSSHIRFRDKLGVKVVKALKRNDDGVTHAAIDMLCALMQVKARNLTQSCPQSPHVFSQQTPYTLGEMKNWNKKVLVSV